MIIGANPASNHPRLITKLVELRRRGGKVIVINPLRELGLMRFRVPSDWRSMLFGSEVSDLYLQPHVGSDIALLKLLLKDVLERGAGDPAFLAAHVVRLGRGRGRPARAPTATALLAACGVRARAGRAGGGADRRRRSATIFAWAMGITQHAHGVDNVQAIVNLALARGMLGRLGAGLLPIRGHSNVQGVGSVGVSPALKSEFVRRLEELYGITMPRDAGTRTRWASLDAAARGDIDFAFLLGGNLFAASPDRDWARGALQRDRHHGARHHQAQRGPRARPRRRPASSCRRWRATRSTSARRRRACSATSASPTAARRPRRTRCCRRSRSSPRWRATVLPGGPVDFARLRSHEAIRDAIARVVPGYAPVAEVDRGRRGERSRSPAGASPRRRSRTAVGQGRSAVRRRCRSARSRDGELRLMTLRSEGQFNTVVYEEEDVYRGNERRDVVMMNEDDARARGLRRDQRVRVHNADRLPRRRRALRAAAAAATLAMYYPEANVLVPRIADPASGTPVFKSTSAAISPL